MAIITIGRGTKSGGHELAKCLSEHLGYPLLGREVAQDAAAQLGVPAEDVGVRMEEKPGRFGRDPLITKLYVAAVQNAILDHVEEGNLVYDGLAGGLLLRDLPGVLSVRLIAPIELATQRKAYFVGKPNPLMMRAALRRLGARREETAIIGDRMDTDIIAGIESGIETVLVLTGVSDRDTPACFPYAPDHIIEDVGSIVPDGFLA